MFCLGYSYVNGSAVLGYRNYAIPMMMKSMSLYVKVLLLTHFLPEGINKLTYKLVHTAGPVRL
jgi:hypothetical protein